MNQKEEINAYIESLATRKNIGKKIGEVMRKLLKIPNKELQWEVVERLVQIEMKNRNANQHKRFQLAIELLIRERQLQRFMRQQRREA